MLTFRKGLSLPDAAKEIVTTYKDTLPATFKWQGTKFTVNSGDLPSQIILHVRHVRRKKAKKQSNPHDLKLPGVPAVVKEALADYGNLILHQEAGYGGSAQTAEKRWAKTRLKLLAWAKRKVKTKRVVCMHAYGAKV